MFWGELIISLMPITLSSQVEVKKAKYQMAAIDSSR